MDDGDIPSGKHTKNKELVYQREIWANVEKHAGKAMVSQGVWSTYQGSNMFQPAHFQ